MRGNIKQSDHDPMKVVSLLYHDAVRNGNYDESGIPGSGAAVYKLDIDDMRDHFAAIAASGITETSGVGDVFGISNSKSLLFLLTFDDGGISASEWIADLLEAHGWTGHFMVTGSCINGRGFLSAKGIRELHDRGHIIGSHSWSHPTRISRCHPGELKDEWERSTGILSDIIEKAVDVASVPGGYYTAKVARSASACGIRALFTSEPVKKVRRVDECLVLGRYTILRGMRPGASAALASGSLSTHQARQYVLWNLKKPAKFIFGGSYPAMRENLLNRKGANP